MITSDTDQPHLDSVYSCFPVATGAALFSASQPLSPARTCLDYSHVTWVIDQQPPPSVIRRASLQPLTRTSVSGHWHFVQAEMGHGVFSPHLILIFVMTGQCWVGMRNFRNRSSWLGVFIADGPKGIFFMLSDMSCKYQRMNWN